MPVPVPERAIAPFAACSRCQGAYPYLRLGSASPGQGHPVSQRLEINVEDLLLDRENPRLGTVDSQPDALRGLVELSVVNFEGMMKSVKANGLDPGDLFFLVDESAEGDIEDYTVVDGNRRAAALKILREPALLVGSGLAEGTVKRLHAITEGFDASKVGDTVLCVLFENRAEADPWILRRHGRGQKGEGRNPWGPLEIQRFQDDRSVLDILEFVGRNGGYAPDRWAEIRAKLDKRSSVLRRFLESKAGRDALGLSETTAGPVQIPATDRDPASLARLLRKLLDDIVSGKVTTRSYNKASELKAYFDRLPAHMQPVKRTPDGSVKPFRNLDIATAKKKPAPAQPSIVVSQSRPPKVRDTLAPKTMEFKQPINAKGIQFLREAVSLNLKNYPLSAAFLLRGFIPFVVDTYMQDKNIPFWEDEKQLDLDVRAERVIDHLIAAKKAKRGDLSGIKRRLSEKSAKIFYSGAQRLPPRSVSNSRTGCPPRRMGRRHGFVRGRAGKSWDVISNHGRGAPLSGHFSPLRYPGGKGKLAKFVSSLVKVNRLHDGLYVEPYAGGAAVAWELLLTGMVRRVHVNDLSRPIYAFWSSVLDRTEELIRLVSDARLDLTTWDAMKQIFASPDGHDDLAVGFAMFYLNRTNRSGILNAGPIGGRAQVGTWNMDARYNRVELVSRIERIAQARRHITLTNLDATKLLNTHAASWPKRTLAYLDPPYFTKGPELYYNFYKPDDHAAVARAVREIGGRRMDRLVRRRGLHPLPLFARKLAAIRNRLFGPALDARPRGHVLQPRADRPTRQGLHGRT